MAGSGKAVVCAVGKNTLRELELTKNELRIEEENTPLSQKLARLGSEIGKWAYLMSFVALVLFTVFWFINSLVQDYKIISDEAVSAFLNNLQTCVALVIVCVPEGLPLALSMALAFSIDKLKSDNLLIKSLKALEATGSLTNIMTGKTATLTEGKLTPKSFISIG